jgi:hypothetical protein
MSIATRKNSSLLGKVGMASVAERAQRAVVAKAFQAAVTDLADLGSMIPNMAPSAAVGMSLES